MANPLPNEKELYARIKKEEIGVSEGVWDLLYQHIGDNLTNINLLCQYYLKNKESIPVDEAKKILRYTRHVKDINNKLTVVSQEGVYFPELGDSLPLHPVIREMLTHYIGNDIYMINLAVQDSIDPVDPQPVPPQTTQKILNYTHSIGEFMERLRAATFQGKGAYVSSEPQAISKEEVLARIKKALAAELGLKEDKIQFISRFREDLGLDSIDTIRVIMALEEEFGFEIPDEAADGVLAVSQAVEYIYKMLRKK